MNNRITYVQQRLLEHKRRFTAKEFAGLWEIATAELDYRKVIEAAGRIPYVPSFRQKVEPKLNAIGLTLESRPANDGSRRKLYAIRPLKENAPS
jgi:hypothetical protein